MAKSQFSKVDEYGFERDKDFDYAAYEDFMSEYLPVLARRSHKWSTLLSKQQPLKRSSLMKRYIRKGIPTAHRGDIWMWASGADRLQQQMGSTLYHELLAGPQDDELVESIVLDLPRTFPDNIFFNQSPSTERRQQLFRVLCAYAHHNRDIGYCQGLNYIVGLLLLVTNDEERAFWLLKVIVEQLLPDYYGRTMKGVIIDIDVFAELLRIKSPAIYKHVTEQNLPWPVIATKWFVCLFAEVLPVETVLRIWDCFFYEGSKIMFRVCLALIIDHSQTLLACDDFGSLATTFKNITNDRSTLNCHRFMKKVFRLSGSLSNNSIERLRNQQGQH